jgi:mRNA interferase HigB
MQVLTKRALREFGLLHPDVAADILDWFDAVEAADWDNGAAVRAFDRTADYVEGDRWVFNLRRNRYRLVVRIFFPARQVYVRSIGTHADYDRIADITTI